MPTPEAFGHQDFNLLPQQLLSSISKQPLDLGVHQNDFAVLVHYDHGIWSGLQKPAEFLLGPLALGDVVNRSNQMGTSAFVVKDRCNADFPGQPPGRVIRCFFPMHDGLFFDRLPVLSQNHRQGRLWDDLVHRFADHRFLAQSGDPQKSRVDRNEAELPFGFDSQMENDILGQCCRSRQDAVRFRAGPPPPANARSNPRPFAPERPMRGARSRTAREAHASTWTPCPARRLIAKPAA